MPHVKGNRANVCTSKFGTRPRRRGMTLVEVLMAAAILGVALTAILTATSRCLAVMRRSREYQQAQWILNRGIAEHPFFLAEDIEEQGVDGVDYDGYVFSREIEDDDDEDGLFLVRSRVTWGARGREFVEEIVQYVYQPSENAP